MARMAEEPQTATASTAVGSPALVAAAAAEAGLAAGTLLGDRYRIDRRLGAGGMGVVHAATDIQLGRAVAVKLVHQRLDAPGAQDRLAREARAMARLRHPNVATIFDLGTVGDRLFIVMELVEGGTLADWLRAERRSWRQVLAAYLPAAHGLAAAHAAGFVHRDFKPENVLRGADGVVRVTDFGVARLLEDAESAAVGDAAAPGHTRDGAVVGTPGYIAPEVLRHEPVDARADQFSFCVALYAALYRARPFPALTDARPAVTDTLAPLPSPPARGAPRWLATYVRRGLASDPAARWPTLAALAAAIERRVRWRGRARVGAVACGLAASAVAAYVITRPAPPPTPWHPVAIGQIAMDSPVQDVTVSRDGSTLAYSTNGNDVWVEPRMGGERRRVTFPPELGETGFVRLTRRGDQIIIAVQKRDETLVRELWAFDVAERKPHLRARLDQNILELDVGSDGSVLATTSGGPQGPGRLILVDAAGAVRTLVETPPGGRLFSPALSPDGRSAAVILLVARDRSASTIDVATGRITGTTTDPCGSMDWLRDDALVCADLRRPGGATALFERAAPLGGGTSPPQDRFLTEPYAMLTTLRATEAGLLFTSQSLVQRLQAVDLDHPGKLRPLLTNTAADLPAAGWTRGGNLIFGASVHGHLQLMERRGPGDANVVHPTESADVPLVVLDDSIVFGRFPGGEDFIPRGDIAYGRGYPTEGGQLFRLEPSGAVRALGPTRGFSGLRCAGDRTPPCILLERRQGLASTATMWDPESGARGREVLRYSLDHEFGHALAPDGHTVARVALSDMPNAGALELIDLDGGPPRRPALGNFRVRELTFAADGSVIASGFQMGEGSEIVRIREGAAAPEILYGPTPAWLFEPRVRADGKEVILGVSDRTSTIFWVDHAGDR
jgi:hypothetical protein